LHFETISPFSGIFQIGKNQMKNRIQKWIKRNQFIAYGLPFLASMGIGSYAFAGNFQIPITKQKGITQIKYDHSDRKTQSMTKHAQLGLDVDRKKQTVAELYFDLMKSRKDNDEGFEDWDFVRVERPEGEVENVYWKK
jgi:hypothetical protein